MMSSLFEVAIRIIDVNAGPLNDLSQSLWHLKELSYQEHQSHKVLCDFLEKRGFTVNRSVAGLQTAFVAEFEIGTKDNNDEKISSPRPHVGVICEYDALPDIGHACGHNLIAEIGVATALAIKAAMETSGRHLGKLTVFGTPGEEGMGGKIDMLNAGVFRGVDLAMMAHPAPFSDARPVFLSTRRFSAKFQGKASHAAGFPWEGVNALDAAVQAYVSIATNRQQMKPEWRAGVIISDGGQRTNIIPSQSELKCQARTPKESEIGILERKLKRCVTSAADATGCSVTIEDSPKPYKNLITNETLAVLYESSLADLGNALPPPKSKIILGSTDMGDVSHAIPSLHPCYNCSTAAFNHTHEFAHASGSQDAQPSTLLQAKALAMTALKVMTDPELLPRIHTDFRIDATQQ